MEAVLKALEELIEEDLRRFQYHLYTDQSEGFPNIPKSRVYNANQHETVTMMRDRYGPAGAGEVTLTILRKIGHTYQAQMLESELKKEQQTLEKERMAPQHASSRTLNTSPTSISEFPVLSTQLKRALVQNFERIMVGDSETGRRKFLNDIYTDLYIVENETGGVIEEHEVRKIEASSYRTAGEETPINCNDIFKLQAGNRRNRKVLTMGIAGVGKTFSVTKFILDWAEGKENQDIAFIFPLPFRELNIKKDEQFSLMDLLHEFVLDSNELTSLPLDDGKVMFVFDGLDECRFSLNFDDKKKLKDINEKTSLGTIITNLIKRNLLPSALIWITSRPAAAHLIPRDYIDYLTEVRGFNDEQRKDYFLNNCKEELATKIITHITNSRSLYIMCQIPVFCWISVSVFETLLPDRDTPTTLTEMYTKFVLQQSYNMKKKYLENESFSFKKVILKLGKLALHNLERGDLIFYEEDLEEHGIDVRSGLVYSGVCTQIFRQNQSASGRKTFSFVHLSIQEFFAALYVLHTHCKPIKRNALQPRTWKNTIKWVNKTTADLQGYALKKAVQSTNGHLDLFVRFLSGLCEGSNQNDLREILPKLKTKALENIKWQMLLQTEQMLNTNISTAASLNIIECLFEMKEDSFLIRFQEQHGEERRTGKDWSILLYKLLRSESIQETFDLKKYSQSNTGFLKLLPVIEITKRALLDYCGIYANECLHFSSVFSADSPLRELDLSGNNLQNMGMQLLCNGLRSSHSKLEILTMYFCNLTQESGKMLASVLTSASSYLRMVDLSNNDLRDLGVQYLSKGLKNPQCKLEILRLSGCLVSKEGCSYLASSLRSNCSSQLRDLDLSHNNPGSAGEEMFGELLLNPRWKLETVGMDHGGELRMRPGLLKYACNLTWDQNTANRLVVLFENDGNVRNMDLMAPVVRLAHPDRFEDFPQVLCNEPLSGRCYWEANYAGFLIMAVSYKRIERNGPASAFGRNDVSWCLICTPEDCMLVHNHRNTKIPAYKSIMGMYRTTPSKLGAYLDSEAGTLSFYNSERSPAELLHRVHAQFTEPLYVGFFFDPALPIPVVALSKF